MYFWFNGRDEELLARGLQLNDGLQSLLAKHDAILSGSPLPNPVTNFSLQKENAGSTSFKPTEVKETVTVPKSNASPSMPVAAVSNVQAEEEEEEEDDFAQLARRYLKNC